MLLIWFKALLGLLIILPGACVILARKNAKFKAFLQEKLLDNLDLFTGKHKFSPMVKWSGWHNIVVGLLIMLPVPLYLYEGILMGLCLGIYLYKEYLRISNVSSVVADNPVPSDKIVDEETVADTSAGDTKSS